MNGTPGERLAPHGPVLFLRRVSLELVALTVLIAPPVALDSGPAASRKNDRSLRQLLKHGSRTRRVIVTVKPGYRNEIRQALQAHGDVVDLELPFVDALAVDVLTAGRASRIVWPDRLFGQMDDDNVVWGTDDGDNIVWGAWDGDNIVWGTDDNIVWGTDEDNVVWGTDDDNVVWGTGDLGSGGIF